VITQAAAKGKIGWLDHPTMCQLLLRLNIAFRIKDQVQPNFTRDFLRSCSNRNQRGDIAFIALHAKADTELSDLATQDIEFFFKPPGPRGIPVPNRPPPQRPAHYQRHNRIDEEI
jgi:hypothetical protein